MRLQVIIRTKVYPYLVIYINTLDLVFVFFNDLTETIDKRIILICGDFFSSIGIQNMKVFIMMMTLIVFTIREEGSFNSPLLINLTSP